VVCPSNENRDEFVSTTKDNSSHFVSESRQLILGLILNRTESGPAVLRENYPQKDKKGRILTIVFF